MENLAGYMQMGTTPAAAGARACGQSSSPAAWQLTDAAMDSKKATITFVDVPLTHRHRRPWGTS